MSGSTCWIRLPVVAVLLTAACADWSSSGPEPTGSEALEGFVWGHVVEGSGVCIAGAKVHIVEGPGAGRSTPQRYPCDAWSYGDGFEFTDLPLGATIKLRASADGYKALEQRVAVGNGGPPVTFALEPD
jgi:hypothetical protein